MGGMRVKGLCCGWLYNIYIQYKKSDWYQWVTTILCVYLYVSLPSKQWLGSLLFIIQTYIHNNNKNNTLYIIQNYSALARRWEKVWFFFSFKLFEEEVKLGIFVGIRGNPHTDRIRIHWRSLFRMVWFQLVKMEVMNLLFAVSVSVEI